MPGKVHVKGKRKAPPPPTATSSLSSPSSPSSPRATAKPNETNCDRIETKTKTRNKSPAPPPPILQFQRTENSLNKIVANGDRNDLSMPSNKLTNKNHEIETIFNIVDPFSRNDLRIAVSPSTSGEPILTAFSRRAETPAKQLNGKTDASTAELQNNETIEVWNCVYCTLENPFWKIVCSACERIKPYTVENHRVPANLHRGNVTLRLRRLPSLADEFDWHQDERNLKRHSTNVSEIQPYAIGPTLNEDDETKTKRNSLIFLPKGDTNTLEMEKERLRSVIRAMNTRALAGKKTQLQKENNLDKAMHKYETLNLNGVDDMKKKMEKKIIDDNLLATDDAKAEAAKIKEINGVGGKSNVIFRDPKQAEKLAKIKLNVDLKRNIFINLPLKTSLSAFKRIILANFVPATSIKVYFAGLLLTGDNRLDEYGIRESSVLYIHTENVIVDVNKIESPNKLNGFKAKNVIQNHKNDLMFGSVKPASTMINGIINLEPSFSILKKPLEIPEGRSGNPLAPMAMPESSQLTLKAMSAAKAKATATAIQSPKEKVKREKVDLDIPMRSNESENTQKNPTNMEKITFILPQSTENGSNKKSLTPQDESKDEKAQATNSKHYEELLSLESNNGIIDYMEIFECSVCLCDSNDGLVLRSCLHTFCKDCIRNTIKYSTESEPICPYIDDNYTCDNPIQDREIRALLTKDDYDAHLAKTLQEAENQIQNSFHCHTLNCRGWCIYEENANHFMCPICKHTNCLTCRTIHDGMNCKQYQDMIKLNTDNNPENKQTREMLMKMIEKGEAMHCPNCRIIIMKKEGCAWLKCSMCKTEICWVTRQRRWGPGGKGDTSAGCRCGVDGKRCHPTCNYCH